jgi:hypothetical protein
MLPIINPRISNVSRGWADVAPSTSRLSWIIDHDMVIAPAIILSGIGVIALIVAIVAGIV